jgi:hypothetical protein
LARLASGAAEKRLLLIVTAIGFAVLFAISWQKWADLAIDGGREMNTPVRLLRGELIYTDVYYLYGPLAPYFNAALYAVFGVHLNTLYGAGTLASIAVLIILFRLANRLSGFGPAVLTVWTVLVFCIFKRNGNYVFPYTYSAVYGTLLGLAAVAAEIGYIHQRRTRSLTLAGVFAGLALICKLEFGFAAAASLAALALSEARGARFRTLVLAMWPAAAIPVVVYTSLLWVMPWQTLVKDTYLWPGDIPAELLYFNRTKLGLNDPAKTLRELLSAVAMLGIVASAVLAVSARAGVGSVQAAFDVLPARQRRMLTALAGASLGVLIVNAWVFRTRWDVSPFRALPVLCAGLIWYGAYPRGEAHGDDDLQRRSLLVLSVYALAALARVILRVPSGGAYGSYLLPVPLLLFTHVATRFHRPVFRTLPAAALVARRLIAVTFSAALAVSAVVIAYRYVKSDYGTVSTARGTTQVAPAQSRAFNSALAFIAQSTQPADYIGALPEGSSLNFLGDRPAPLRYEILTPGFLDAGGERRAIEQLARRQVRFIFLLNRPTIEFGCRAFGRDCYRDLMGWIDAQYEVVAVFGEGAGTASEIGDPLFFIKAYRRRATTQGGP